MDQRLEKNTEMKAAETMEQEKEETKKVKGFRKDDRGVGVIEIVLILVILIGLVLIFKQQITAIINNAFAAISGNAAQIIN